MAETKCVNSGRENKETKINGWRYGVLHFFLITIIHNNMIKRNISNSKNFSMVSIYSYLLNNMSEKQNKSSFTFKRSELKSVIHLIAFCKIQLFNLQFQVWQHVQNRRQAPSTLCVGNHRLKTKQHKNIQYTYTIFTCSKDPNYLRELVRLNWSVWFVRAILTPNLKSSYTKLNRNIEFNA